MPPFGVWLHYTSEQIVGHIACKGIWLLHVQPFCVWPPLTAKLIVFHNVHKDVWLLHVLPVCVWPDLPAKLIVFHTVHKDIWLLHVRNINYKISNSLGIFVIIQGFGISLNKPEQQNNNKTDAYLSVRLYVIWKTVFKMVCAKFSLKMQFTKCYPENAFCKINFH